MEVSLPKVCFSTLPTTGELILLKRGEKGYFQTELSTGDRSRNELTAEERNRNLGVSRPQRLAMECGSMHGWDIPGADPQTYLNTAEFFPVWVERGQLMHPILSISYPFKGQLFQNITAGELISYISLDSIHPQLMGQDSGVVILPDLVKKKPMLPVQVVYYNEEVESIHIEEGATTKEQENIEGYSIIARIQVGRAEIVLGESAKAPSRFGTWKRVPAYEQGGKHDFFWGHYFGDRTEALKDFESRVGEEKDFQEFKLQRETPKKERGDAR